MTPDESTLLHKLSLSTLESREIQERLGWSNVRVWRTLKSLKNQNLIECLTPEFSRNRIYRKKTSRPVAS